MPRSRRALLEATGGTLGSLALASVAGCLASAPTGGGAGRDESTTEATTQTDEPETSVEPEQSTATTFDTFEQWLPDPTETLLPDGYGVQCFDVASIRAREADIHPRSYSRLEDEMSATLPHRFVDVDDVDAALQVDFVMNVALGSFDPDAIGEKIASEGQSKPTASTATTPTRTPTPEPELNQYRGFDLYGTERIYAVSEDAVMNVSPMRRGDPLDFTKAFVDAQAGEVGRYADGNEYVASMFELVDDPHACWCYPEAMDGSTSRGFREDVITGELKTWRFGAETTRLTFANTYPDAEAAANSGFEAYIENESDRFGAYDGLDVQTEDRLVWVEGTIPTDEFDHLSAGGPGDSVNTPN
ncbi:hypothetical protein [Halogranum rubrum]|uniref:Uncharacterized protein n=1 Tax=Halogranum salarium B-1 TaxID=1210908 RepID=J3JHL3_9EURY|nr:hypothetical protein [Halogranum salarium]EJN61099.1 hypothetical protein HSB1_01400 [Halogranum salarium B-1]